MRRYFSRTKLILILLAIIVLLVPALLFILHGTRKQATPAASKAITYSTDKPSEIKPAAAYEWRGGPDDPKYIRLPSIAAEGYIQQVGVDQHKQVAVPNNIHMAGWFVDTVRPGQTGLSIIDGHVDGHRENGIFKKLQNLRAGDEYSVELANGHKLSYKVLAVRAIDANQAASALFSQNPEVRSQLNLITCGGPFDSAAKAYKQRIVVSSELETSGA